MLFSLSATVLAILVLVRSGAFVRNEQMSFEKRKNILVWTPSSKGLKGPEISRGYTFFKNNDCNYKNCFIIGRKFMGFLTKVENFDAILFNSVDITRFVDNDLPMRRSPKQRYVFVSTESADRLPLCYDYYNGFFNWTMTYRLDSDIPDPYFTIKNKNGRKIGPDNDIKWTADMLAVSDKLKLELAKKTKLAAWFVSHCSHKRSHRMEFVTKLQEELKKYNFGMPNKVDIYGDCGPLKCPKNESEKCFKMIEKDYVFYMAMENSYAKDYLTEKVLIALNNKAIPIVYGGANYSRFLPPGSYIDAKSLGPGKLAKKMHDIIKKTNVLHTYFKWHNNYTFEENVDWYPGLCDLCAALHEGRPKKYYENFLKWWNDDYTARCGRHLVLQKKLATKPHLIKKIKFLRNLIKKKARRNKENSKREEKFKTC